MRAWGQTSDVPVITTHCSNNYGPFQHAEELIPSTVERALDSEPIPLGHRQTIRRYFELIRPQNDEGK